ncbi:MAG TPA: BrnA antitoxin family protein [Rhizomicrobium sp.]|nr:BrnA antitoxin family protein [Rhizomicrobium sp.]
MIQPARDTLTRRGRPKAEAPKQSVHLRLSPDVLRHFRKTGPGWQARIEQVLRKAAKLPVRNR